MPPWAYARAHMHACPPSGWQVLKVAILAEKYAVDYSWYVDTILNLIRIAGDYVSEEVWYRVLQIVTNRDDVQGYAAKTVFEVSTPIKGHQGRERTAGTMGLATRPTVLLPPPQSCSLVSLLLPRDRGLAFTGRHAALIPRPQHLPTPSVPEKGPVLSCFTTCELEPVT